MWRRVTQEEMEASSVSVKYASFPFPVLIYFGERGQEWSQVCFLIIHSQQHWLYEIR